MSVDTLACSATESTSGSVDVKKGFIAFRYLKLGKGNTVSPFANLNSVFT